MMASVKLVLKPVSVVLDVVVGAMFWQWFVVPSFGVPPLSWLGAFVLQGTARYFCSGFSAADIRTIMEEDDEEQAMRILMMIAAKVFGLLIGWLLHVAGVAAVWVT